MAEEKKTEEKNFHKKFAVDSFNLVWTLMENKNRTIEENDKMIHAAHASRFQWGEIGTPVEFERGEWQISRMYTVLNRPEPALYHAKRCLDICKQNNIGDWEIAFAYEAMARAYATAGNKTECEKYIKLAKEAGELIKEKGDKDYLFNELKTIAC
ncbi:hypothetical protein HXY33_04735 [Candidatus Bathyarchaeota archaeon]|nr:hypothetical protein [Candidatus Bathyarchaeota archaeon]